MIRYEFKACDHENTSIKEHTPKSETNVDFSSKVKKIEDKISFCSTVPTDPSLEGSVQHEGWDPWVW